MQFKISDLETTSKLPIVEDIKKLITDVNFGISIGTTNSNQITSNIDSELSIKLGEKYNLSTKDAQVYVNDKLIGTVDVALNSSNDGTSIYIEIEKSNKKTLWFDYVKLVTKIEKDKNKFGIVICPKNWAHARGTWNLYSEALSYREHFLRLSSNDNFDRIAVIGYTQFAYLDDQWKRFCPEVIQRIKEAKEPSEVVHEPPAYQDVPEDLGKYPAPDQRRIGNYVYQLIPLGLGNQIILSLVRNHFPNSNTTLKCISWYRSKLQNNQNL